MWKYTLIILLFSSCTPKKSIRFIMCNGIPIEIMTTSNISCESLKTLDEIKKVVLNDQKSILSFTNILDKLKKCKHNSIDARFNIVIVYDDNSQESICGGYNYLYFQNNCFVVSESLRTFLITKGF